MPDYELDVPQTAWQRRHFIPDHADCAVKAFSRGGESSTEHELLPASHKVLLIEPVHFQDIFIHCHSPPPPKDWVSGQKFSEPSTVCSNRHNNNLVKNVLNDSSAACPWWSWQIPDPLEKSGRLKEEGWGFHLEKISGVPFCEGFQACLWTRMTVLPTWYLRQYLGISYILLATVALLSAVTSMLVSAVSLSMPESILAGDSIAAVSQLLVKDSVSAQAPHHFCLVPSSHSTKSYRSTDIVVKDGNTSSSTMKASTAGQGSQVHISPVHFVKSVSN